jgi:hypothetical protein
MVFRERKRHTERHHQIKLIGILEREFERNNERIVNKRKDSAFRKDMSDLPGALRDVRLANSLECVYPLRVLLANLHHFTETALSNYFEEIKGFDCEWFIADGLEIYLEVERTRTGSGAVPLVGGVLHCKKGER